MTAWYILQAFNGRMSHYTTTVEILEIHDWPGKIKTGIDGLFA
jgi:hypothetical protein